MLECLVNFIAKCKLSEFAIGFCHSKKMYVTIFFCDRTNVRSKLLLLGHLPNLVGHCPMSDSNLQPWVLSEQWGYKGLKLKQIVWTFVQQLNTQHIFHPLTQNTIKTFKSRAQAITLLVYKIWVREFFFIILL
jgi:hypothetical protein